MEGDVVYNPTKEINWNCLKKYIPLNQSNRIKEMKD